MLIAAPTSGSGKTTVARGLMALLSQNGMKVQPYKCGPDYIDTKFHTRVCGRPSVNLDTFMATASHVRKLYAHYAKEADACIVEGMMGMYDGYDRDHGSSAEIAQLLGIPVLLVVDARSAAYSMAALLKGFIGFRPEVRICGVIFNKVGSTRHLDMLQQVCDDLGIECFGYLPKHAALDQGSRYLGLDFSQHAEFQQLVELIEKHVDWQRIIDCTTLPFRADEASCTTQQGNLNIAVALNSESFSFIYQEHLDILRKMGNVTLFDPEQNSYLDPNTDLLYLPGGYPEKHVESLVHAKHTRTSIKEYAEKGGRILAECGGMMYLCEKILTEDGEFPMCGALPYTITARKEHRKLSLGYRQMQIDGRQLRGHEFHYSQFLGDLPPTDVQVYNAKGDKVPTPVFRHRNIIASYTHLYWGDTNILELFENEK